MNCLNENTAIQSVSRNQKRQIRNFIALIFMYAICSTCFGQTASIKTDLIIIGTIHTGNKKFNHKTLYNVLSILKPDIILKEYSEKYKPVFGLKTATFLKIAKPSIEQLALQTFSKRNKSTLILPYDTSFPRKKYIKSFETISQAYHDSLYNAKKTIPDSIVYAEFISKHNNYHGFIDSSTLDRINQQDVIDKSRELYFLEDKVIFPLGKKYISDSLLMNNVKNDIRFWEDRNKYMVNAILNYSKQYAGKRIVVLTGLNHKYYLQDILSDPKIKDINIVEFPHE